MRFFKIISALIIVASAVLTSTGYADYAAKQDFPHGQVELQVSNVVGAPLRASTLFKLDDGWHIYGKTAGAVGLPTEVNWQLPSGVSASELAWPAPKEFTYSGLKSLGYENELEISSELFATNDQELTGKPIAAEISWLICKDECIPGKATLTTLVPLAQANYELIWAILAGLVGGLLLNIMPCVFPVLSLKILCLVDQSDPQRARRHALAFAVGVIMSFWFLSMLLIILRSTGQHLGWGFQFQSPTFVASMVVVLLLVALNLLGVFEIGASVQCMAGKADRREGLLGAFLSGVLATAVATPCTAPVMGTAIAFALSRTTLESLLIFTALGIGMSAPFVLLSYAPRLVAFLPRPGAWMNVVKQILAFPLLASVIWLLWVLRSQVGIDAVFHFELALVLLCLGAWIFGQAGGPQATKRARRTAVGAFIFTLLLTGCLGWPLNALSSDVRSSSQDQQHEKLPWEPFSVARIKELRQQQRAILVDFTAAWCLMCQVNHRVAFQSEKVAQHFAEQEVALLRGDWTNRDEAITAFMAEYGRDGVPLDLFFSRDQSTPTILPALLTPGALLELHR